MQYTRRVPRIYPISLQLRHRHGCLISFDRFATRDGRPGGSKRPRPQSDQEPERRRRAEMPRATSVQCSMASPNGGQWEGTGQPCEDPGAGNRQLVMILHKSARGLYDICLCNKCSTQSRAFQADYRLGLLGLFPSHPYGEFLLQLFHERVPQCRSTVPGNHISKQDDLLCCFQHALSRSAPGDPERCEEPAPTTDTVQDTRRTRGDRSALSLADPACYLHYLHYSHAE